MKLAILTTETSHHAFFVREMSSHYSEVRVFCETDSRKAPFETRHLIDELCVDHENNLWFEGKSKRLAEFAETCFFPTMNDASAIRELTDYCPDAIIVFGTGKLKLDALAVQKRFSLNLHGGDPEEYRGLDSHLWAIYHGEFCRLVTTLHTLNGELDDGEIVLQSEVELGQNMQIHELRAANTRLCVKLASSALAIIERWGELPSRPQRQKGRYYSAMPSELKEICRHKFYKFTSKIVKERI